jgi:2-dehydro-3-deoxygalactonokinase
MPDLSAPFLACDWGTTQVRAWRVAADGSISAARTFPLGVSRLQPGEAARRFRDEIRPALDAHTLPAILCGMIGSNLGWTAVPYLDCPVDLAALGGALHPAPGDASAWIVPGLRGPGPTDAPEVMRGEETQVLGWLAQDPARAHGEHVVCLPGTHAKWTLIQDGRIVRFLTAMTGELFEVLSRHSVLRADGAADDPAAFRKGVEAAGDGDALSIRLFSARSRVVGAGAAAAETASYLSGLLIGAEIAATSRLLGVAGCDRVALIGDPALCGAYIQALNHRGFDGAAAYDGGQASLAGLIALNAQRNAA